MICKYCNNTGIWISPIMGNEYPCEECSENSIKHNIDSNIQYDEGSGVPNSCGDKYWFLNSKRHRVGGPAIEFSSGTKEWYIDGKLHRLDGPAIEWCDGDKWYYWHGMCISKQEWESEINGLGLAS